MNNNYENSSYICNYYNNDANYYNSFNNETNDKRVDSLYENYMNSYPNIDYKTASNATNYRHFGNGWQHNWVYPQTGFSSYYEPNYSYNRLEPLNEYQSLQSDEVERYSPPLPYNDIQSHNLDKTDKGFEGINGNKWNYDHYIPLSVHEVEKQIKTEGEFDEIVCNERQKPQTDCFQIHEEILQIEDNSCEQPNELKGNENLSDNILNENKTISKPQRIRRKNGKAMTSEELRQFKKESNRLAATKCRQKKLQRLEQMKKISVLLIDENVKLEQRLNQMRDQIFKSKLDLIYHRNNDECRLNAFRT